MHEQTRSPSGFRYAFGFLIFRPSALGCSVNFRRMSDSVLCFRLRTDLALPPSLQTPWFGAPAPIALEARQGAAALDLLPQGFRGRAGLLVSTEPLDDWGNRPVYGEGELELAVRLSLEPWREPLLADPAALPLPRADALVGMSPDEVFEPQAKAIQLTDGSGSVFSLYSFAEKLRAGKPEKIARGGGAGLNLTHAHWNKALLDAVSSPLAKNLLSFNRMAARMRSERGGTFSSAQVRPIASLEWWCGPSPACDVKFDGMPLSPVTTSKPLIERLLAGHAVAQDERFSDPRWRSKRPLILADTPDWVVIVKPSGLLSVPGAMGLPDAMTMTGEMTGATLTPVHRLDMDTSGLIVYSKNLETTKRLMADFREGRIEKQYVALVRGVPADEEGEIRIPLTTNPIDRLRQVSAIGGRDCVTKWRLLRTVERSDAYSARFSLLALTPVTGRTHQLRVHCAHALGLGMPIVGDPYYGPEGLAAESPETPLALHSGVLSFEDPSGGGRVCFDYPAAFES